jgi:mycothiol synthase
VSAPAPFLRPSVPDAAQLDGIHALIAAVERAEGRAPLSDQALTHLTSTAVEHVLTKRNDIIIGYAQLDGDSLEIAAEPDAVGPLLGRFRDRDVLVWSHGEHSRLIPALTDRGFSRERELFQLRRRLDAPVDAPPAPDGIEIRAFRVGVDEDDWLAVNAAAFADHAEQGSWTRADLEAREREAWFDPAGFLLAWRGTELVGFHWTKVHPDGAGEVYVIGIAPTAQGLGLGSVLLRHGLASLSERGCREVLLYVDGNNTAAVGLYERYGFGHYDLDAQWRSPGDQSATGTVSNT